MDEVLEFIKKFKWRFPKEQEVIFTEGNCYYFAVILRERFSGKIYYLPIVNHFICKIGKEYYDITGKANLGNEKPWDWEEYQKEEPLGSGRIIRDCIRFDTRM